MPVTQSAIKAHRQSLKRQSRNRHLTALYKEAMKSFERALAAAKKDESRTLLNDVYSTLDVLQKNNILHRNNVARKKSTCAKLLKALCVQ